MREATRAFLLSPGSHRNKRNEPAERGIISKMVIRWRVATRGKGSVLKRAEKTKAMRSNMNKFGERTLAEGWKRVGVGGVPPGKKFD